MSFIEHELSLCFLGWWEVSWLENSVDGILFGSASHFPSAWTSALLMLSSAVRCLLLFSTGDVPTWRHGALEWGNGKLSSSGEISMRYK